MRIEILSKELLLKHLQVILKETKHFHFLNWRRENYLLELPKKWQVSVISLDSNKPAGFSICSIKKKIYYIHFFYVFRSMRECNVGKKLISKNVSLAKTSGKKIIQLLCNKENISALNFYFKNKFYIKEINKNTGQYLMERKIS